MQNGRNSKKESTLSKQTEYQGTHSAVIKQSIFQWWDYLIFLSLSIILLSAILHFFIHWFSQSDWREHSVPLWIVTALLAYQLSVFLFRWFLLPLMKKPKPMLAEKNWKVGVATTFVPGAESFEMLEKTLSALVDMRYPHDTWVLDEGDDDRVKALCVKFGAYHFSRKHLSQYQTDDGIYKARTKHGNYNAWLSEIGFRNYDIFTNFDPDHIPSQLFLDNVIGYFADPSIGYVQAAQAYYNQDASFIARGAAEETYAYYSSTQMIIYNMDFPIVVGCHTTHRMTALEQVNGFAPHDADDLLITFLYRNSGWQGVYLPEILAKGLTPVDWSGYLTQQLRWSQSVLDIKFRVLPKMDGSMPFKTRLMGILHGLYYIQEGISGFVIVCLVAFMLATGITPKFLSYLTMKKLLILMAVLQFSDFYRQRFFLDWRREWGMHWRASILRLAKWPFIFMGFVNVLTNRKRHYTLTLKVKSKSKRYVLFGPHLLILLTFAIAWLTGWLYGYFLHPLLIIWVATIGMFTIIIT